MNDKLEYLLKHRNTNTLIHQMGIYRGSIIALGNQKSKIGDFTYQDAIDAISNELKLRENAAIA